VLDVVEVTITAEENFLTNFALEDRFVEVTLTDGVGIPPNAVHWQIRRSDNLLHTEVGVRKLAVVVTPVQCWDLVWASISGVLMLYSGTEMVKTL